MRKLLLLVALLFWPAVLGAQQKPLAATTVQTTDTSANSALIGCNPGSTTCTGGIKAGALVIGGGTSITSSTNIPLKDASNTFSAANPIILGAASTGTLRTDSAGYLTMQSGSTGFKWVNNANNATRMTLTDAGLLSVTGGGTFGSAGNWWINAAGDFTIGASNRIALSNGTPVVNSGGSLGAGTDFQHTIALSATTTSASVSFGHTFASQPFVVAYQEIAGAFTVCTISSVTTTGYTVGTTSNGSPTVVFVLVVGK